MLELHSTLQSGDLRTSFCKPVVIRNIILRRQIPVIRCEHRLYTAKLRYRTSSTLQHSNFDLFELNVMLCYLE